MYGMGIALVQGQAQLPAFGEVVQWAGALSLACFSGTFLGGLLLSFTWSNFGPWNQLRENQKALHEARNECETCRLQRELDAEKHLRQAAEIADLKARYNILALALEKSGLQIQLGTPKLDPLPRAFEGEK